MKGLKKFSTKIQGKGDEVGALVGGVAHFMVLIDPEQPWQKRAEAGFAIAALVVAFLPQPFGLIGKSVLSSSIFNVIRISSYIS